MKLDRKLQLIVLQLQHVSYRDQFMFLKWQLQHHVENAAYSLTECDEMLNHALNRHETIFASVSSKLLHRATLLYDFCFCYGDEEYPLNWKQIPKPPLLIFYIGEVSYLAQPNVAIIGTRKMSTQGKDMVKQITELLCDMGIGIVSGLAEGCDEYAHLTALKHATGRTIGIIPTGLLQNYPLKNADIQKEIAAKHLLLSEYLPDERAKKHHFIMRNRLVASLTPVTILIESAQKGGSLITANYAIQYNRELMVCPGSPVNTQAYGCNQLIAQGAYPIYDMAIFKEDIAMLLRQQKYEINGMIGQS